MVIIDKGTGYFKAGNTKYAATSLYYYIDSNGLLYVKKNTDKSIGIDGVLYNQVQDKATGTNFTSPADLETYMDTSGVGVNPSGGSGGGGGGGTSDASAANQVTGNNLLTTIRNNQVAGPKAAATSQSVTPATDAVFNTTISNFPTTQQVSQASQPLPTGASTSALQSTGNTSLGNIDSKVATSTLQNTGNTSLSSIDTKVSTSALQTTGNTSLSSIDGKVATAANQTTANTSLSTIATNSTERVKTEVADPSAVRTITTGGTAQVASATNSTGRFVRIINKSAETLYVNTVGTATINTADDSIPLLGSSTGVGGIYESSIRITNAISIIGATTGSKYSIINY